MRHLTMSQNRNAFAAAADNLLREAHAAMQAGSPSDARQKLQAILLGNPRQFQALHLLGVVEGQLGRPEAAAALLEQALQLQPRAPDVLNNLGMILYALGRHREAADRYRAAIALAPGYAIAHNNLGIALSSLGQREEAAACFRKALELRPDYPEALSNLGAEHFTARRFEAARDLHEQALTVKPSYPEAELNLGNALSALGRYQEALPHFERAIALKPNLPGAALALGRGLNALNRFKAAIPKLREALAVNPNSAEAALHLGIALSGIGRRAEAVAQYELALRLRPDFIDARNELASALVSLKRHNEAIQCLTRVLELEPDNADAEQSIGVALAAAYRDREAVPHYRRALELRPQSPKAKLGLARSLRELEEPEEAEALLRALLADDPTHALAHVELGWVRTEAGDLDEACRVFDTAIALAPREPVSYLGRISARKLTADSPHLAAMQDLAREMAGLSEDDCVTLHFALGRALTDTGEHQRGFEHLLRGNATKKRQVPYDEATAFARFESTKHMFTPDLVQHLGGHGDTSRLPIFILGMPRSGSTLVEQILASHPLVFAGGERPDFRDAMHETLVEGHPLRFPSEVVKLDRVQFAELGANYVARLRAAEALRALRKLPAERITDKMPANFRFAGLIPLALPNARIIHTIRDPVDTCLSCFSTLFGGSQPFAYDLGELGRYYRGYADLMEHWRRVLPAGVMLDVQYETLVDNFEAEARRILAHCGVDWHEDCLAFHRTERPVRTASMSQVRQPLYRSAIGRWRIDRQRLRPLLDGLGWTDIDSAR